MWTVKNDPENWRRLLWAETVGVADEEIPLGLASLLFASDHYPKVDITAQIGVLDELARDAARWVAPSGTGSERLGGLAHFLHGERGFGGTQGTYNSPRGCFLNEVLEHRTGLPITLSVIYLEVGWRLGLPLGGVGLPGHFIIRQEGEAEPVYCDPYNGGRLLTEDDCRRLVREQFGAGFHLSPQLLAPVSRRAILYRMLNNLKAMYINSQQPAKALWATDRMLILQPESAQDMRDRGLLAYALGKYSRAHTDLVLCMSLRQPPHDTELVLDQLPRLRRQAGILN